MALFGSSRPSPLRIGCFGKLPIYGDFLSAAGDSPEAQEFVNWLQEGVAACAVPTFAPDQMLQMLWQPASSRRTLAALLWPSQDQAGRRFPFAMFASLPGGFVGKQGPRALVAADGVWRAMRDARPAVVGAARRADVDAVFRDLTAPPPPEDRDVNRAYVDRAQAAQFRREDFVPVGLHVQDLVWFAENLGGTADPRFALRMRLHGVTDPVVEGATWLHVLSDRLGLGSLDAALVVRTARADGASVFAFRRALSRDDFGFLFAPGAEYRGADHLGFRVAPSNASDTAFLARFQRAWSARQPSCATVLEAGAQGWTPGEMATGPVQLGEADPPSLLDIPVLEATPPTQETGAPAEVATGRVYEAEPVTDPQPPLSVAAVVAGAAPRASGDTTQSATQPTTEPAGVVAPAAPAAEPVTGEIVPTPRALADRVRELARRPMMSGRVVRLDAGGPAPVVLLADGSSVTPLRGVSADAVEELERRTRDHDEAMRLIAELERIHREMETELRRMVGEACTRSARTAQEDRRV